MIFTIVYMYSTLVQWWRLGILRNKLNGTLNGQNALVVTVGNSVADPKNPRSLENLLFQHEDRIGCTIVPRQTVDLKQWVNFPKDPIYFPIHFGYVNLNLDSPKVFVLLQALIDKYVPHEADIIEIEKFGELLAWRAVDYFEVILMTDMENVTKLVNNFAYNNVDINHELRLLKIETVDVDDNVTKLKFNRKFPIGDKLNYSVGEVHWKDFAKSVKELYNKIYDVSPKLKIQIENGSKLDVGKKVPISEVKPIKKETKKDLETTDEKKDTLNVKKAEHRPKGDRKKDLSPPKEIKKDNRSRCKVDKIEASSSKDSKLKQSKPVEHHKTKDHHYHHQKEDKRLQHEDGDERKTHQNDKQKSNETKDLESKLKDTEKHKDLKPNSHQLPQKETKSKDEIGHKTRESKYKDSKTSSLRAQEYRMKEKSKETKEEISKSCSIKSIQNERKQHKTVTKPADEEVKKDSRISPKTVSTPHGNPEQSQPGKTEPLKVEEYLKFDDCLKLYADPQVSEKFSARKLPESDFHPPPSSSKDLVSNGSTFLKSDPLETSISNQLTDCKINPISKRNDASKSKGDSLQNPVKLEHKSKVSNIIQEKNIVFTESKTEARKMLQNLKPPNILVYADSLVAKENVKDVLNTILNKEKYTVYDLPINKVNNFWDESTTLVVVCGNVTPSLTSELLQYLVNGGQLLCLCSDLLYSVLQTFSTAEVREHELVRFSYGNWQRVKMMHHIFCYQASPAKKQFSKESDHPNHSNHSNGSSPVAPRTPSAVDIQHNGNNYTILVQVLGTEETWQTPSLLLASVKDSKGRAIFSQVHLEVDPTQYQDDENKYAALTDSNQARLEILKHILSNHLDVDCSNEHSAVCYTPGYFLGRHDMKLKLLNESENIKDNTHSNHKLTMVFCGKDMDPGFATATRLPVMVLSCPSNFSTVQYYETLQTQEIGRLVIYSDVLGSSHFVLIEKLQNGLVVIPRQQTQGVGRSSNVWLSPLGCAMFSLQLHVPMNSVLGKSLPLVQHLVMVAVVSAIRNIPGYEEIELGLKWPNDLYAYSNIKIGGLVVTSQILSDIAIVNIGCGVNLNNSNPTTCLNDIIAKYNEERGTHLEKIPYEKFFAMVFNEIEMILNVIQKGDIDYLFNLYYKYWLHGESDISVMTKEGETRKVKIIGIDDFGYLTVQSSDGVISSVQPDGNTFDMLKGLIAPKFV